MNVGPRTWKTGLAVILSIWVSNLLGLPSILAVIAAIIGIQPSVAQSFTEGWNRIAATVIGGVVGFIMVYFLNADPILVGLAVVISIIITINLKLQNAVVLTAITAAAVMTNVTGPAHVYAGERLLSTVIGIIIGVLVNFLFAPPNFEQVLFMNMETLNYKLKAFYVKVLCGFIAGKGYDEESMNAAIAEIRDALDGTRKSLFQFKNEIGFRRNNNNNNDKVKMYESILSSFNLIFERILGIYNTEYNRAGRGVDLSEATPEYGEIVKVIKQLLAATVSVQDNLIAFLTTRDADIHDYILSKSRETKELAGELKEKIGQWHLVAENRQNVSSLMELANIGYEIEQIINFLERIVRIYWENRARLRGVRE